MNDYLTLNLKSLEKRFPQLARRAAETADSGFVRVEKASSGDATGVLAFPAGQEKRLHSSRDPKREAMRWAESIPFKPFQTLAVFADVLAPILAKMQADAAQKLTIRLANRLNLPETPKPAPVAEAAAVPAAAPQQIAAAPQAVTPAPATPTPSTPVTAAPSAAAAANATAPKNPTGG